MALSSLPEELVEEILLRVPPDEPACLIRAALVCKAWRNIIVSNDSFLRRYRRFHRTPPLLGYIHNVDFDTGPQFVPRSNFSLPWPSGISCSWTVDCRHGRVLIYSRAEQSFIVWDPITCSKQHLDVPAFPSPNLRSWAGAVLCAVDGCDHLDCHGRPFIVIFVGAQADDDDGEHTITCTWASIYSSATGAWSTRPISSINNNHYNIAEKPTLLIGEALYFTLRCDVSILKFDLTRNELSLVDAPEDAFEPIPIEAIDGGGLGFIMFSLNCVYMWTRQADADGISSWIRQRVVELDTLIPIRHRSYSHDYPRNAIRFVEGTNTILISLYSTDRGVFTLDLKSRHVRKISKRWDYHILPYMSFYTPDLAAKGSQLSPP